MDLGSSYKSGIQLTSQNTTDSNQFKPPNLLVKIQETGVDRIFAEHGMRMNSHNLNE